MKLSVIIVTWNSGRDIADCLDAVLAQADGAEVIVIDNHSTDLTPQILGKYGTSVRVILNDSNRGFAAAANQGIGVSSGEFLLLLNPDAAPRPGALPAMLAFMHAHPETGGIGPQLLNPDGSIQPSCREFPRPMHFLYEFSGLAALFPRHRRYGAWRMGYFDHQTLREVDQPMGACLLVRRSAADQIGGLDAASFPMFFNEVDWCYRIRQAGWQIHFFPGAQVLHHKGTSIKKARLAMTITSHFSLARFLMKHHSRTLATYPVIILIMVSLPLRLILQSAGAVFGRIADHE